MTLLILSIYCICFPALKSTTFLKLFIIEPLFSKKHFMGVSHDRQTYHENGEEKLRGEILIA